MHKIYKNNNITLQKLQININNLNTLKVYTTSNKYLKHTTYAIMQNMHK